MKGDGIAPLSPRVEDAAIAPSRRDCIAKNHVVGGVSRTRRDCQHIFVISYGPSEWYGMHDLLECRRPRGLGKSMRGVMLGACMCRVEVILRHIASLGEFGRCRERRWERRGHFFAASGNLILDLQDVATCEDRTLSRYHPAGLSRAPFVWASDSCHKASSYQTLLCFCGTPSSQPLLRPLPNRPVCLPSDFFD